MANEDEDSFHELYDQEAQQVLQNITQDDHAEKYRSILLLFWQ